MAEWCLIDPREQYAADTAPDRGLVLVRIPPAGEVRGGIGQIQLRIGERPVGDVDLALCGPCRRAVLEQVRVDDRYRRLGFGRVLVAAAVALAPPPSWSWSTTKLDDSHAARAFWSSVVEFPGTLGEPNRCTDMQRAAGILPDW